jgi:DNA-binding response OmpR family regulator
MTPKKTSSDTKKTVKKGQKRILIVEDEKPLAHALQLKVTHEGYDVNVALTGDEGLKAALEGKYDLILMDLIMPGMDGFTVLTQLKEKHLKTKVIVLSNLGQDEDRKRAADLGAVDYFVKANTPIADIITKINSTL